MNLLRRLLPLSGCGRAGLALWLAVGMLVLLLAWLSSGTIPLVHATDAGAAPAITGDPTPPPAAGSR